MTVGVALFVVAGFVVVVLKADVVGHASDATERVRASVRIVRDRSLGDDEKERHLREGAGALLTLFVRIAASTVLALGLPLGAVWLLDRAGVASWDAVTALLLRIDFLVAVSLAGLVGWWVARRLER